jgi:hypothetical protein
MRGLDPRNPRLFKQMIENTVDGRVSRLRCGPAMTDKNEAD